MSRIIEEFFDGIAESAELTNPQRDLATEMLPLIREAEFVPGYDEAYGGLLAAEPLVADLWLVYGFKQENTFGYLNKEKLAELLPDEESRLEHTLANLGNLRDEVSRGTDPTGTMHFISSKDDRVSTLLLDHDMWKNLSQEVGIEGELIVCVPARNYLLFADSADAKGMATLVETAREIHKKSAYALSSAPLRWLGSSWEMFRVH